MATTTNNILSTDLRPYSLLQAYISEEDGGTPDEEDGDDSEDEYSDLEDSTTTVMATTNTSTISDTVTSVNTINLIQSLHEYELNQSESLTFLYNLLYDNDSNLSKADILKILNSLKLREVNLPFTINHDISNDVQGIKWPRKLHDKFYKDRLRVGKDNWFHNIPNSREDAIKNLSIHDYSIKTDFYKFDRFFGKLKLHITHLQLRNLVCCGSNIGNGVYYPLSYFHDAHLQTVNGNPEDEDCHAFFKINRLMPDKSMGLTSRAMKVDCLIDSRNLMKNSNSKISTLECTNNYLVSGTFEGGYILSDVSDPDDVKDLGEYQITNNIDGITNHVIINETDNELIISSNDKNLRLIDLKTNKIKSTKLSPFPINCAALNTRNTNEIFVTGDNTNCYIQDKRESIQKQLTFSKHFDFGFGCDWSPTNENLLLTGNQDCTVKIWDRRKPQQSLQTWSGALGFSDSYYSGPVRNCKFSYNGEYIAWAESLDHVGILETSDLLTNRLSISSRVQSIDFVGKCCGLRFAPMEQGHGEELIVGVIDCPLGGILSYKLESKFKPLAYDFYF